MKNAFKITLFFSLAMLVLLACGRKEAKDTTDTVGTPVTVTTISTEPLVEYIDLNATSTFLLKNYVKANVNGYIKTLNVTPGQYVNNGQLLFTIVTKEAKSIGNAVNKLDPSFRFSGVNRITAGAAGYIKEINHQVGDYVQDGEQLAIINDVSSFAFILNLPYELRKYLSDGSNAAITLPDGTKLTANVASAMPTVDATAQTQNIILKVSRSNIPENLIAAVRIIKSQKTNTQSLPKEAVLTNDVQSEFWVMKMIDSVTAVKVLVKEGMVTKDRVEVTSPQFTANDRFLLSGNFGLPDTAKVKVQQQ